MSPADQVSNWISVANQLPDPAWMEECLQRAEVMGAFLQREQQLNSLVQQCAQSVPTVRPAEMPPSALAENHFYWLGNDTTVHADTLRGCINAIAMQGYISLDQSQQEAMRRSLGMAIGEAERHSQAPWVIWMGEIDVLCYIIQSLWQLGLLNCMGGESQKWNTLRGAYLRPDRRRLPETLRNNRIKNEHKRREIDRIFVNPLQRTLGK